MPEASGEAGGSEDEEDEMFVRSRSGSPVVQGLQAEELESMILTAPSISGGADEDTYDDAWAEDELGEVLTWSSAPRRIGSAGGAGLGSSDDFWSLFDGAVAGDERWKARQEEAAQRLRAEAAAPGAAVRVTAPDSLPIYGMMRDLEADAWADVAADAAEQAGGGADAAGWVLESLRRQVPPPAPPNRAPIPLPPHPIVPAATGETDDGATGAAARDARLRRAAPLRCGGRRVARGGRRRAARAAAAWPARHRHGHPDEAGARSTPCRVERRGVSAQWLQAGRRWRGRAAGRDFLT